MNILAIDIGNTRVKWGLAQDSGWLRQGWVATAKKKVAHGQPAGSP